MTTPTPIQRAALALNEGREHGSIARLAELVGVTPDAARQAVHGRMQLPADWCERIERATGVTCEELRPDLSWARNEEGRPHYARAAA